MKVYLPFSARVAWRNLWRHRRRTALTMFAVSFSCGILIFFMSIQFSAYETSLNAVTAIFQGQMQVQHADYLETPEMREVVPRADSLLRELAGLPGVRAVAPRAQSFVVASSATRSYGAQVVGISPELEGGVSSIPLGVVQGRFLQPGDSLHAVLGVRLAERLRMGVGDELTLLGQAKDGSTSAFVLEVVGVFKSGVEEIDQNLIEMPLAQLQELFSLPDEAHVLVVNAQSLAIVPQVRELVAATLGSSENLAVRDWRELTPGIEEAIKLDMTFGWLFYGSLVLIVVFTVTNTMLMSVLERTREFGLLLACGARPWRIIRMVLLECGMLLALSGILGFTVGGAFVGYYGQHGFVVPGSEEILKIWHVTTAIHPRLSWASSLTGPMFILLAGVLATLIPALRIRRLRPVQALSSV